MFLLYGVFRRILFWGQLFCLWSVLTAPQCDRDVSLNNDQCFTRNDDHLCFVTDVIDPMSSVVDSACSVGVINICEAFRMTLRNILKLHTTALEYDFVIGFMVCWSKSFGESISGTELSDLVECFYQVFNEVLGTSVKRDICKNVCNELSSKLEGSTISADKINFVSTFEEIMRVLGSSFDRVFENGMSLVGHRMGVFLPFLVRLKLDREKCLSVYENVFEKWKDELKILLVKKGRWAETGTMVKSICKLLNECRENQNKLKEARMHWLMEAIDFVTIGIKNPSHLMCSQLSQLTRLTCDIMLINEDLSRLLYRIREQTSFISIILNSSNVSLSEKYISCRRKNTEAVDVGA